MKLNQHQLRTLKQNLLDLAFEHVQDYISDLILDFEYLDRANANDEVPPLLIFIARDCGTDLGAPDYGSIQYHLEQSKCIAYEIDIEKLVDNEEYPTSHYTNLRHENDVECVIRLKQKERE